MNKNPQVDNTIYEVKVTELKEYPKNARVGNVAQIAESLMVNGQYRPIVVRKENNEILAGNHTYKAARELGWETIKVSYVENLTDEEAAKIVLADNRYNELGTFDNNKLLELLKELDELSGTGYDEQFLQDLKETFGEGGPVALTDPDEVPEEDAKNVISKQGDLWLLGEHKLLVGDATVEADYKKLLNGVTIDCIITDPPYNVDYMGGAHIKPKQRRDGLTIKNDLMPEEDFNTFLKTAFTNMIEVTKNGGPIYVFHADRYGHIFRNTFIEAGWLLKQVLIWVKNMIVLSRQDYHWQHEPILYGWKAGAAHPFVQDRTQSNVIDEQPKFSEMKKEELLEHLANIYYASTVIRERKPARSSEHPTMKPVSLIVRLMENSTNVGETVLDVFAGSGSTLIAAYGTNRKAYLMEYDPVYADVICKRWQKHTGVMPINATTNKPYDFLADDTNEY